MKLSATIVGAAFAATLMISATAANASAVVTESYDYSSNDAAYIHVTNGDTFAYSDVAISGGYNGTAHDFGALAAGGTIDYYMGDNENNTPGSQGTALVTVLANGQTYSGSFTDVLGDPDVTTSPVKIGALATGAVPEPSSWAMMLTGFGLLGFAMRNARAPRSSVVAA